jgi:hypothetical protein
MSNPEPQIEQVSPVPVFSSSFPAMMILAPAFFDRSEDAASAAAASVSAR